MREIALCRKLVFNAEPHQLREPRVDLDMHLTTSDQNLRDRALWTGRVRHSLVKIKHILQEQLYLSTEQIDVPYEETMVVHDARQPGDMHW